MSIIIGNARVKDYKTFKPVFERNEQWEKAAGLKDLTLGRMTDDPNHIYMIWKTKDPSIVKKLQSDPDLRDRFQKAGVIGLPEYMVLNED